MIVVESFRENSSTTEIAARFLPVLPPHFHPHTGMLPDNWEDYDEDPEIPDITEWQPIQIRDYFAGKGFDSAISDVFLDQVRSFLTSFVYILILLYGVYLQEIDGRSLLLLQRGDVTSSLGLKLGPALKVFSHVKKLQTRRNFPDGANISA